MKWKHFACPQDKTRFIPGDWNTIDDRFGLKQKAGITHKQWDGFRTKAPEHRHEQDFLRSTKERIRTPWSRPEQTDTFVNAGAVVKNGTFLTDSDWTKGASWSIANGKASWTAGSSDTLSQSIGALSGSKYKVTYTLFNYVGAGNLTVSLGTGTGTARTGAGEYEEEITSGGSNILTFTPDAAGTSFDIDFVRVLRVG